MHIAIPTGRPRIRPHYRGFAHVGRCRPQTVRAGRKARGKTRHFRNEGCFFPVREAGSSSGPANTIGELGHRIVECVEIYVGFQNYPFGNCQHLRGFAASTPVKHVFCRGPLRGFQHYRRMGASGRGKAGNLRGIRGPPFRTSQHHQGYGASGRGSPRCGGAFLFDVLRLHAVALSSLSSVRVYGASVGPFSHKHVAPGSARRASTKHMPCRGAV